MATSDNETESDDNNDGNKETDENEQYFTPSELLELALKSSGDSVWRWNLKTGRIELDDNWIKHLGYEPGTFSFSFEWWDNSINPESKQVFEKALEEYLNGDKDHYEIEYQIRTYKGDWIWVWAVGKCVRFDEDHQPVCFVGTHRDITWQKAEQLELQELKKKLEQKVHERTQELDTLNRRLAISEKNYRELYNKTPVMLHSIGRDGKLLSVSEQWLSVLQYSREEVIGKSSTSFLTEESKIYAEKAVLPIFYKTGSCKDIPYQFVKKNGEVIDVLLSATSEFDEEGNIIRSLAVLRDITEQLRSERERNLLISELKNALDEIKTLKGILPICVHCKKIRDDKGIWNQLEKFIHEHSAAKFSHCICPDCKDLHYPWLSGKER